MQEISRYESVDDLKASEYGLDLPAESLAVVERWLVRGDGCAVYQNAELGHPMCGHCKYTSYGSPEAQIEVSTTAELPRRMPDIGSETNWRYQLVAVIPPAKEK